MAIEVKVPDIGDFKDVPIIEVHVQAGARVKGEDLDDRDILEVADVRDLDLDRHGQALLTAPAGARPRGRGTNDG